jgi:branched-chain amino acid transport system ATP-binding protein
MIARAPSVAPPALACSITVGYDGVAIARDVTFEVGGGRVTALLGPNGAGKTTTLLTLAGFLAPIDGTVQLDGQPAPCGSPRRMNRAGVVLVPDSRALFMRLSAAENIQVARRATGSRARSLDEVLDLFPALRARASVKAGMLSGGEQQMLALARAIVQRPRVLLIDEMSMGLAPIVVESLVPIIRSLADDVGAAVVLVEQHVTLALDVADDALVLVHGEVVLQGTAAELRGDPGRLQASYLGS